MRVLLDECLPRALTRHLPGHETRTAPQMGWAGIRNGQLLALAEAQFEVFITIDQKLESQQRLAQFTPAVIVLHAASNRWADLAPPAPAILAALPRCQPGVALHVGSR